MLSLTDFALSPITGTEYLAKSEFSSASKKSNQKLIVAGESTTSVFQPLPSASPLATQFVDKKYKIFVFSGALMA
jgi:hypothetical protein